MYYQLNDEILDNKMQLSNILSLLNNVTIGNCWKVVQTWNQDKKTQKFLVRPTI